MKELHVKSLLPVRLDKYLMDQYPALGLGRLNKALRENKIKLNGKKQPLSTRVQNGDTIRLFLSDDQLESRPTPAAVFVYEDDDIIIANKPAGLTVDGGDADTLVKRVQAKLAAEGKPTHAVLCHRLDTGTSGQRQQQDDGRTGFREVVHHLSIPPIKAATIAPMIDHNQISQKDSVKPYTVKLWLKPFIITFITLRKLLMLSPHVIRR